MTVEGTCVLSCQGLCLPVGERPSQKSFFQCFSQVSNDFLSLKLQLGMVICHAWKRFCPSLVPLTSLSFPVPQSRRQHDEHQGLHPGPCHRRAGAAAGRRGPGNSLSVWSARPEPHVGIATASCATSCWRRRPCPAGRPRTQPPGSCTDTWVSRRQ